MNFDADMYTVTVRKENVDGDFYFVGRVSEFPNISSYEDTYDEARLMVIDSINSLHKIAIEDGVSFPEPIPSLDEEYSGRVTLRMPKSLHAKIAQQAILEDVSVNQYLVTAIATYAGEVDVLSKVRKVLSDAMRVATLEVKSLVNTWTSEGATQPYALGSNTFLVANKFQDMETTPLALPALSWGTK